MSHKHEHLLHLSQWRLFPQSNAPLFWDHKPNYTVLNLPDWAHIQQHCSLITALILSFYISGYNLNVKYVFQNLKSLSSPIIILFCINSIFLSIILSYGFALEKKSHSASLLVSYFFHHRKRSDIDVLSCLLLFKLSLLFTINASCVSFPRPR